MDAPASYSSSEDKFFDADSNNVKDERAVNNETTQGSTTVEAEPNWGDDSENFDRIYEINEENELGNVQQQHGSVLMHLLSQVSL